jgi:hypothetical protein
VQAGVVFALIVVDGIEVTVGVVVKGKVLPPDVGTHL